MWKERGPGEGPGRQPGRPSVTEDDLHVRIHQVRSKLIDQGGVDLDSGHVLRRTAQNFGRETRSGPNLDHPGTEVHSVNGAGEDQLFENLLPVGAGTELHVALVHLASLDVPVLHW